MSEAKAAMSVRVVAPGKCFGCGGAGRISSDDIEASYFAQMTCPQCRGTGTVEREVSCDGCRWFNEIPQGYCGKLANGPYVAAHFGCKAWEPREPRE